MSEGSIRASSKGKTWLATAHSLAAPRAGLAGFVAAPRAGLEVSEGLKRLKGTSGSFGQIEKKRLGLLQLVVGNSKKRFGRFWKVWRL